MIQPRDGFFINRALRLCTWLWKKSRHWCQVLNSVLVIRQSVVSHAFKNVIPGETRVQILKWASVGSRLYQQRSWARCWDNWWLRADPSVYKKWNLGDFFTQISSKLGGMHALAKCLSFNHLAQRTSFLSQVSFSCLVVPLIVTDLYPAMPSPSRKAHSRIRSILIFYSKQTCMGCNSKKPGKCGILPSDHC